MKIKLLLLGLGFLALAGRSTAQSGCSSSYCSRDTLQIRSGYDHKNASLYGYGSQDAYFKLIQAPSPINVPAPPFVISPNGAWNTLSGTRWISAHNNSSYNTNNPAPASPYVFETTFCTCQEDSAYLYLQIMVDDVVTVTLDNDTLGVYTAGYYFYSSNTITINHADYLSAGSHSLQFHVRNTGGVAMGLNVSGTVIGGFTLDHVCCSPTGSICGVKYEDENGNGERDNGEEGLENWTIILEDSAGNPIDTMVTDMHGDYCFTDLEAGYYRVRELQQVWWVQNEPDSPGFWHFFLDTLEIKTANFGNQTCPVTLTDTVILNTGYNPDIDSTYHSNSEDLYWTIIQDPWNNNPYPAVTINTPGAYQPALPNSKWIRYPTSAAVPPQNNNGLYSYERCFCLSPGFTNAELTMSFRVDDSAHVFLNGHHLGQAIVNPSSFGSATPTMLDTANQSLFRVGQNCIRVDVINDGGPTGLNMEAFVTTSGTAVVDRCCDSSLQSFVPGGSICGIKFNDLNCDGILDFGEPLIPNWNIILRDSNNVVIDTVATDSNGTYCFNRLPEGNYFVSEELPANWDQSLPGDPDYGYLIQLLRNASANADFGNCEETCFVYQDLKIGTGFDPITMLPLPTSSNDLNWTVLSDPLGNIGTQPFVQPGSPFWFPTASPSQWIHSTTNPSDPPGIYSYEMCFCIKDSTQNISINFQFRADDDATISINGNVFLTVPAGTANSPSPFMVAIPSNLLVPGRNCIQVDVNNATPGTSGFSMYGTVSSSNPFNLNYQCCPRGPEPNPGTGLAPKTPFNPKGSLKQNVPNPANGTTSIGYFLPFGSENARIEVYDIQGRLVRTVLLENTGDSEVIIHTGNLNHGVYIYKLVANGVAIDSKHMIIHR